MKKISLSVTLFSLFFCTSAPALAQSTYSPEAVDQLRYMIEEEKLAGSVYRALGELYPGIKPFQNIPKSEDQHYNVLVAQANQAGINVSDLTGLSATTFLNQDLQTLYGTLVSQGSASSFAALTVGKNIEILDIEDLNKARALVSTNSSLYTAYGNLINASQNHLQAFNTWLAKTPAPVQSLAQTPAVPEPESYAMFIAGLGMLGAIARRKKNQGQSPA